MKKIFEKMIDYFSEITELPVGEMITDECANLSGRNEAVFFGCRSVLEYGGKCVKLKMRSFNVCISGEKLELDIYSEKAVRIKGKIETIYFGE